MMHKVLIAIKLGLGLAALSGSVGAVALTPTRSGEVLIEGLRTNTDLEQRTVSYADLQLASPSAQRELMRRVSFAVDSLCNAGDMGTTDPINSFKCSRSAWENVKPRIESLLTH